MTCCSLPCGVYLIIFARLGSYKFISSLLWDFTVQSFLPVSLPLSLPPSLIILASLPLPLVFILRQFHLVSDGSNALSVTYKKGRMMKDISNLEDNDETRFILSKVPSETPSPMPTHRSYLGPGSNSPMEMSSAPNGRYGSGYLLASTPESEL